MKFLRAVIFFLSLGFSPLLFAESGEVARLSGVLDAAINAIYGEECASHTAAQKQLHVREVIEAEYDLNVIIRRAIGRNWRAMEEAEQQRVLELVKRLVVRAYVNAMEGRKRPEIEVGELVTISDKRIEIPSTVTLEGKKLNVLYRLGRMKSGWQIYDIVAEDISVISNYRKQIDDHFRKGDGEGLIIKLEELIAKDTRNDETQT